MLSSLSRLMFSSIYAPRGGIYSLILKRRFKMPLSAFGDLQTTTFISLLLSFQAHAPAGNEQKGHKEQKKPRGKDRRGKDTKAQRQRADPKKRTPTSPHPTPLLFAVFPVYSSLLLVDTQSSCYFSHL